MKFSMMDFFSKCDQIRRFDLHVLKKSLIENLTFCAVHLFLCEVTIATLIFPKRVRYTTKYQEKSCNFLFIIQQYFLV